MPITTQIDTQKTWQKKYDRKIKVSIAGYGFCKFGVAFGFQDHPNVEVIAVTDLIPERCHRSALRDGETLKIPQFVM